MDKIKVGIIGASGYGGAELVRLLLHHPYVQLVGINARSYIGQPISQLYPGLYTICDTVFESEDDVIKKSDLVFASLPHGVSEPLAKKCNEANKRFIDLGADFRLVKEADYEQWYHLTYKEKALHEQSVYGLSEINRQQIKDAMIVGNPGCYPTSIALAMYPIITKEIANSEHIIIDAKSGTTGAGKEPKENTHFPRANEAFAPYKVAEHRHTPEIEQMLSAVANKQVLVTFVPHLLPINRGIISTIYLPLKEVVSVEKIHEWYVQAYADEPFVRVLPLGQCSDLKFVKYSNYCDISLHLDTRSNTLIVVSAIDNMVKGAAGQAIQNMNIMYGLEEDSGLRMIAPSF